ncbi:MAG: peptidoglycan DD-metalloendopeptidase family protein [Chloroflexi bacterium]|nr:peptidoglycan DD-metalloendopeptidase family protein [Chloroflexota bacterium]
MLIRRSGFGKQTSLAALAVGLALFGGAGASMAQQADPQAQLNSLIAQQSDWQQKMSQAQGQISKSSAALAAAKAQLGHTQASLAAQQATTNKVASTNSAAISDLQQQLADAQTELDGIIRDNTDRQNKLISDLGANQFLQDQTDGQIQATSQQIDYTNLKLTELGVQIAQLQGDEDTTQQQLDVVLRETYKQQQKSLLEFLLDSVSFGDFLTRVSNLQAVAGQEDHLLTLLKTQHQQVDSAKAEQQQQLQELQDLQAAQQEQKQTLVLQQQDQQNLLEAARVEAQEANARISAREAQIQNLIDTKQGQIQANQAMLQQLKDAQNQLNATISNQADTLNQAQQQEETARTQLDRLEREVEGVTALINQAEASQPTKTYSSGQLAWPESGPLMQGFGPSPYKFEPPITYNGVRYAHFHTGIDIGAPNLTPIKAAADGQVIVVGYSAYGYGNYIVVAHNPHLSTLYAHMSRTAASQGQVVKQGQVIGYEGSTGNSTGPHLHFEVRIDGNFVNPLGYL